MSNMVLRDASASKNIGTEEKHQREKKHFVQKNPPDRGHGGGLEGNSGLVGSWPSRAGYQPDTRDYQKGGNQKLEQSPTLSQNFDQNYMLKIRKQNKVPHCLETPAPPTRSSPTSVQARAALVETEFKINITEQRSNQTSGLHFHNCLLKQYLDYGT